jgi:DNA oxidative demethylase
VSDELPAGLVYLPDFVTDEEEAALVEELDRLEFDEIRMRGRTAKRTVRHFGVDYDYDRASVSATEPLPESFDWLRDRAATLVERTPDELAEVLVTRYPPGAGIGWHRDAPMFGEVIGISQPPRAACASGAARGRNG